MAAPTRAMVEKVYALAAPTASRMARDGSSARGEPEKAATPAASARTPEPTMFLNRLMIDGVTPVPDDGVPPPAASSVADVITSPEAVRAALGAKEVDEAAMRRPSCGCCTASACCAFGVVA